jgi:glycosyltransferase involved in cell wall biosynthesis
MVQTMNIMFKGMFYNGKGYAEGNRVLLSMLHRAGHPVKVVARDWRSERKLALTKREMGTLAWFESTKLASNDVFINRDVGFRMEANPAFRVNIAHTTFETDRIPHSWVPVINRFDEVWVQCKFNIKTFLDSGVKVPIRFIPYFFDDSRYIVQGEKMPLPTSDNSFKFLSVFQLCERKGYDLLVKGFMNEFSADEGVSLIIKVRSPEETPRLLHEINKHVKPHSKRPKIHIMDRMFVTHDLLSLYRACDAFVLPTRGEGWGRPLFEAMLMELPTLGTNWSGQTEYMNRNNSYLIEVDKLVRIENNPDYDMYNGHHWAEPSLEDLQQKMRYVFTHRKEAKEKGRAARRELLSKYNMGKVGKLVDAELSKFRK